MAVAWSRVLTALFVYYLDALSREELMGDIEH